MPMSPLGITRIRIRCPGLDQQGCGGAKPGRGSTYLDVLPQRGDKFQAALQASGWILAAGIDADDAHFMDPLCPACACRMADKLFRTGDLDAADVRALCKLIPSWTPPAVGGES